MSSFLDCLKKVAFTEQILFNEPMKNHTTFKIGGPADYFVKPNSVEQIVEIIHLCKDSDIPYYFLGNGSNVLVSDKGIRGVVIHIGKNFSNYSVKDNMITAQAGIMLSKLAAVALEHGLKGLEFASGIPGTLGGAVRMNAGAYGGEMEQVVQKAETIDSNGNIFIHDKLGLDFSYRSSIISKGKYVVTEAQIMLEKGEKEIIRENMKNLNEQRKQKQPLEFPSAGSTFKRPKDNFAGKLIMDAGLKGYSIGDAMVSEKHCGFLINKGSASSYDMLKLISYVRETVYQKFGITLETEIEIIGE